MFLVFDGDSAGKKACERSLPILLKEGLSVKFLDLGDSMDPDEFLSQKEGLNKFKALKAQDLFLDTLKKQSFQKQGADKISIIEEIAPLLFLIQDEKLKAFYFLRILDIFGSDRSFAEKLLIKSLQDLKNPEILKQESQKSEVPLSSKIFALSQIKLKERLFLTLILQNEDFLKQSLQKNLSFKIQNKLTVQFLKKIEGEYQKDSAKFKSLLSFILASVDSPALLMPDHYLSLKGADFSKIQEIFKDIVLNFEKEYDLLESRKLISEIKMGQAEEQSNNLKAIFEKTKQRLKAKANLPQSRSSDE